jgi:NAD+ synthase
MTDKIVDWIRKQVQDAGAKGCVFGLSGGLDSAVVGVLCKRAFPENTLALVLPCCSREEDIKDAQELAEKFSIPAKLVDLEPAHDQLYLQLEGKAYSKEEMNIAIANLKPRLRMITLYYHANKLNYLVVGTGNKSEAVMGYFTKYGDGGVDICPLGGLLKSQVRELAKELDIPAKIIKKIPSAGLWSGQTDEQEMGITYAELDKVITGIEKNELAGLDPKLVGKVKQRKLESEHKRRMPAVFIYP